jgi:hypothetical protein
MKIGDTVILNDRSYSMKLTKDGFLPSRHIYGCVPNIGQEYVVLEIDKRLPYDPGTSGCGHYSDILLQSVKTGEIFTSQKRFCSVVAIPNIVKFEMASQFKVGDKVRIRDWSYSQTYNDASSFKVTGVHTKRDDNFIIVGMNVSVPSQCGQTNNVVLKLSNGDGIIVFSQERFLTKIPSEPRYYHYKDVCTEIVWKYTDDSKKHIKQNKGWEDAFDEEDSPIHTKITEQEAAKIILGWADAKK